MANSKQILLTVYFVLCIWTFVDCNNAGYPDTVQEWRSIVRKIDELQNTANTQSNRISQLEKQNRKLEETVKSQGEEIAILKTNVRERMSLSTCEKKFARLEKQVRSMMKFDKGNEVSAGPPKDPATYSKQPKESLKRRGRFLAQPTSPPTSDIAVGFYAYFSNSVPIPGGLYILKFDTVITNGGNGYHAHVGTFIATRSGLYVFTWTIRMYGAAHHTTEILVNNSIKGAIYFDAHSSIDGSVSNTVVVHVNQGDDVFLRTGKDYNDGSITSDSAGRSSFAGWMLV